MECRIPGTDEKSFGHSTAFVIKFSIKQEQPVLQEGNKEVAYHICVILVKDIWICGNGIC
jgi:hypothetical protein